MDPDKGDLFLDEIDSELRSVNTRLKKAISETKALLQEHLQETQEVDGAGDDEAGDDEGQSTGKGV
jgi:hypothetical protein